MSLDEYILGLLAIISGLAISDMVGGLHRLLSHRRRVRWHWLTPLTALFVAYYILSSWWVSWMSFHGRTDAFMLGWFLLPVSQLVCIFLAARGVLPDELPPPGDPPLDLERFYFASKRYVWAAIALNNALIVVARAHAESRGQLGGPGMGLTYPLLAFGIAFYSTLALVDNRWLHRIAVPLAFAIVVAITIRTTITN